MCDRSIQFSVGRMSGRAIGGIILMTLFGATKSLNRTDAYAEMLLMQSEWDQPLGFGGIRASFLGQAVP